MSSRVTISIDEQEIIAPEGKKLLWAALENDIYIPNLCAVREEEHPPASCRLCFVEVVGNARPVTACTMPVRDGMIVKTRSPEVDRLVRTAFELLLSDHRLKCSECGKNRSCELQKIAKERGFKLRLERLNPLERNVAPIDESPDTFLYDRSRCVLCGRCVWADHQIAKVGAIGFARRGIERQVSTFADKDLADSPCIQCGKCVEVCPVGALLFK